jgi:glycosidase
MKMDGLRTSVGLVDQLTELIKKWVSEFRLKSPHNSLLKAPHIYTQFLPPKTRKEEEENPNFPHIIIRYVREEIRNGVNYAEIRIIAGTVDADNENGFRDVLNVLTRIRNEMLKQSPIGVFELQTEGLAIEIPEEQYEPHWVGYINAKYSMPTVQNEGGLSYVS